ncbi:hypothetical protein [Acinetobacter soli]|uniref:hypothetical protein n=1 Tax=Acinetobacter soli TaxID=487316 RepID=UPI00124E3319|nr:hypothetical protein [Acinetobacter soli]
MNNYKIINTHTNEVIEALNELGYVWTPKKFDEQDCLLTAHWILATQSGAIAYSSGTIINSSLDFQELTLPQLRDLVVLHRNDIGDANYKQGIQYFFVSSKNEVYWFNYECEEWQDADDQIDSLTPIQPESKQGLISGEEAYKRIGERIEVEAYVYQADGSYKWEDAKHLTACDILNDGFDFRLKPRTVKLEIEVPAPFEPKVGDMVWFISSDKTCGYSHDVFGHGLEEKCIQYGAWRTKPEIIIVVEQLRKLKEHSK